MFSWFKRKKTIAFQVQIGEGGQIIDLQQGDNLLAAALERGVAYPHNCRVGTCGHCKTKVLSGKVKPMMDFALSPLTAQELKEGYVLACQSKVQSDLLISVKTDTTEHRTGKISSVQRLPGEVLALKLELDLPLKFEAGQYANMSLQDSHVSRSYSFADEPLVKGNNKVSFLIRRIPGGAFSDLMWQTAAPGMSMSLTGPYGSMGAANVDVNSVCIAGGTGLAPVLSIVLDRLKKSSSARFTILFGMGRKEENFAHEILEELSIFSAGRVQTKLILSDEPLESNWSGNRGLVTDLLTKELMATALAKTAFVCGSTPMVKACRDQLISLGWEDKNIYTDAFLPSGAANLSINQSNL